MEFGDARDLCDAALDEISSVVIADETVLRSITTAVLARGHALLEDVPGTGKTLTARTVATVFGLSFSRVQFTPDLLPADVTGTYVFDEKRSEFDFQPGPIFANVVLADEINRASPTTQAALLEAMDEGQVTVEGETHELPEPFFVIATQNPVERGDGTFPLPEAQKDRFLIKQQFGYPSRDGELELLDRRDARDQPRPTAEQVLSTSQVRRLQATTEEVRVHDDLKEYVVDLVRATRADSRVDVGVSPRGIQRLFEAGRAHAVVEGRSFVTPDDLHEVAVSVLAHRLVLTADATVANVSRIDVVEDVLDEVAVPTINREARP